MRHTLLALYLGGSALALAAVAWGQETSAPPILVAPSASAPAANAPNPSSPPPPSRAADHPQSSDLSAMLSASAPAYAPPPPPPPPKPEEENSDLRDVDKPRNRIIRLPKYVVRAAPPPIFREQDIYTKDGIARMALLRYRGLSLVPGADFNSGVGTEMYNEDLRLQNMGALEDSAQSMLRGGDKDEAAMIRAASQSTYQQSLDWGGPVPQNPSAYGANGLK